MPTRKRRVGFIPRSDVLEIINQLSFEANLSNSKIINILVEEALYKRGMFNKQTDKLRSYDYRNQLPKRDNDAVRYSTNSNSQFYNDLLDNEKLNQNEVNNDLFDLEIYKKFLMFLKFQEEMRKN
tara:strand:+ start:197 stop:571 length:375 start_codon:yes stop_codon:yes gene_type:complete